MLKLIPEADVTRDRRQGEHWSYFYVTAHLLARLTHPIAMSQIHDVPVAPFAQDYGSPEEYRKRKVALISGMQYVFVA